MNALKKMNWIELNWVDLSRVELNHWVNQSINQSMTEWMNDCMNEWMSEWMSEWVNDCMSEWVNEWLAEWMNEWMNSRTNERMNEWRNEWTSEWVNEINDWVSECFIFKECSGALSFYVFYVKSSSRYSPVHFLSTTFADRGPHQRKQRPYFGDHGSHFTRKNTGFRAQECFQAWSHAFPTCYTSQILDDDDDDADDDVVDRMMWLTWWWECCPWQSSVTRKFSNSTSLEYSLYCIRDC